MTSLELGGMISAVLAMLLAIVAMTTNLLELRRSKRYQVYPQARFPRYVAAFACFAFTIYYALVIARVLNPFESGPFIARPLIILMISVLAADSLLRRRGL